MYLLMSSLIAYIIDGHISVNDLGREGREKRESGTMRGGLGKKGQTPPLTSEPVPTKKRGHVSVAPPVHLPYCLLLPSKPGQAPPKVSRRGEPVPNAYGTTFTLNVLVEVAPAASVTRNWNALAPSCPTVGVQVNRPVKGLMAVGPNGAVPFG